ncbi:MAG: fumarate hydratase C-terminal domain-containing protein [Candidatus Omnitrophica bacterium]|nr:fumarate hydratase C-terminal domain-containing protein [Candidatus Omnitrophota bacterium]
MIKLEAPLTKEKIKKLHCGQEVVYDGMLYTARDQAHKRIIKLLKDNKKLPFDIEGKLIYYCGPNPAAPGKVIGACGPTTSARMDAFTPELLKNGLLGTIGKGERSQEVVQAIKRYAGIYFSTYAGCGALLAQRVKKRELVCFEDLGTEAVFSFEVKDFPLIVAIDCKGESIYEQSR